MSQLQDQLAILTGGRDRKGGAIVTFPASGRRDKAKPEDYRKLLQYLIIIPNEDVRGHGFTVIIDMRGTSTWDKVKPILKVLHEYFASFVCTAHIIKPDNFWQKQRTSLGSQKYKFEVSFGAFSAKLFQVFKHSKLFQTNLIGLDALLKVLDPSQLTPDLHGTLQYDHSTWIEMRCAIEDFQALSHNLTCRLDSMRDDLSANDFADDVGSAKKAVDAHMEARRVILKVPVENAESVGQRLLQRWVKNSRLCR